MWPRDSTKLHKKSRTQNSELKFDFLGRLELKKNAFFFYKNAHWRRCLGTDWNIYCWQNFRKILCFLSYFLIFIFRSKIKVLFWLLFSRNFFDQKYKIFFYFYFLKIYFLKYKTFFKKKKKKKKKKTFIIIMKNFFFFF